MSAADRDSQSDSVYAHTLADLPACEWEPLLVHLHYVADRAAEFASAFGTSEWGRLAGLWHDLGKYQPAFQRKLHATDQHIQVEHAGVGAALAVAKHPRAGLPLAFVIAGHHAGLANHQAQGGPDRTPLLQRLRDNAPVLTELGQTIPADIRDEDLPTPPAFLQGTGERESVFRSVEFWTRFLFSALVDADRQCTAAFYARHNPAIRLHADFQYDSIAILRNRLDQHLDAKSADVMRTAPTPVNAVRADILNACRNAAQIARGLFSLTVPTGGGKTLSGMSFALNHANARDLRRVIVVIPFTSIIEQNAKVYRDVLGGDNVIEHHSNFDEQKLAEQSSEGAIRRKLAAENWDAPVIVTTTVQFFESLLSDHPSRCRKLHNVANSVIILDEVQTLPPQFLLTILDVLTELTERYGCSIVLSTATPPALRWREGKSFGVKGVRDIIPDPDSLAGRLARVRVHWPANIDEALPYAELAERMKAHRKVLAIVHQRRDARALAELLPEKGRFHLSALMCPAHRLDVLAAMRAALAGNGPCRLVSTQLIEAGVDIDFPVVYRALAGMDSLAQAAGRCNREGKLMDDAGQPVLGDLIVFRAETNPPTSTLRLAMESTTTMLRAHGPDFNLFDPERCEEFFENFYLKMEPDAAGVQTERALLNFANVAMKFKLIDEDTVPVIVPYGRAYERLDEYQRSPTRAARRALQPFIVSIRRFHQERMRAAGSLAPVDDTLDELLPQYRSALYHMSFGLILEDRPADPSGLIG